MYWKYMDFREARFRDIAEDKSSKEKILVRSIKNYTINDPVNNRSSVSAIRKTEHELNIRPLSIRYHFFPQKGIYRYYNNYNKQTEGQHGRTIQSRCY
jgi:hypothetical protein